MTGEDSMDAELRRLIDAEQAGQVRETVLVNPPDRRGDDDEPVWRAQVKARPVLPAWLRSTDELKAAAGWAWSYCWRTAAFHAMRLPVYAGRLAGRSPHGAFKTYRRFSDWLFDAEGHPVRHAAVDRADAERYIKLTDRRNDRVRLRLIVTFTLAIPAFAFLGLLFAAPGPTRYAIYAAIIGVLGWVGMPADKPLISRAVVPGRVQKLTDVIVERALGSLGLPAISAVIGPKGPGIDFPSPIVRDGPGWRAEVDLPHGVTVTDILERRDRLASGLRRPIGCVWPEPVHEEHPGRLVLWVGDRVMARTNPPAWPLAKKGRVDLFAPFPFGTDQRGRVVTLTLMFASMVIGSIPRMGKTAAMRLILLAAALDPRAELHMFDLKGTGDFSTLQPVAHRYRAGAEQDDIDYGLADMRQLQAELNRRTAVIRELPFDRCPENKVTPELAGIRSLGLHPVVLGVDECQRWFENPSCGKELEEIGGDLVRRGPAVGIIAMFGTQRPDAKSLPTAISANAVLRFCLKVMGHTENDMVLGTSAHKNGVRATMFSRGDLGIGYLAGEGDDPKITRSYYPDAPAAASIVARARTQREAAGTLTGHALGETIDTEPAGSRGGILDDIATVVPASEAKVWSETVVRRLAELRPEVYAGWKPEQLAAALKPHRVPVGRQVWGTDPATGAGANRKGIHRDDIITAITERDQRRSAG